ncbi:head closure Hc1 [Burkholderia phage BcepGomr]|uniref:head closure Hc1 n=1 Tax=Burkholderia phage BcepGomr TaxID=437329 RepID=UPI000150346F|nr:head closure Hc1 [Burkholderia phage BcepGomr]ABP63581.1 BcepGomrgp10 [Burkholderia phage BcepGomr]
MKSFNYPRLLKTVDRLIEKFGEECFIVEYIDAVDPTRPFDPPVRTEVRTPVKGVFVKATEKHADGTLIHIGDQLVLISGSLKREAANIKGDLFRGAEKWKMWNVVPLKPGPVNMLFKIKVSQ